MFVCLGNICRSPTAHAVFKKLVDEQNLGGLIQIDSSGTGDWHVGHPPDERATLEAKKRGYDMSDLRAQQISLEDFESYDYILAMDKSNLVNLKAMCPEGSKGQPQLFLSFSVSPEKEEVPDPYYGGDEGFAEVLDMIERASDGLLQEICRARALQ